MHSDTARKIRISQFRHSQLSLSNDVMRTLFYDAFQRTKIIHPIEGWIGSASSLFAAIQRILWCSHDDKIRQMSMFSNFIALPHQNSPTLADGLMTDRPTTTTQIYGSLRRHLEQQCMDTKQAMHTRHQAGRLSRFLGLPCWVGCLSCTSSNWWRARVVPIKALQSPNSLG